jgi:hypothetical protein
MGISPLFYSYGHPTGEVINTSMERIFEHNKYTKQYYNIIDAAVNRTTLPEFTETHHKD